jgi:hypothetical protein
VLIGSSPYEFRSFCHGVLTAQTTGITVADSETALLHWRNDHGLMTMTGATMAQLPSDDEVGRQILSIFVRNRVPARGTLRRNNFFDVRDGDFQRGLNQAVKNNWIAVDRRNRYRYELTPEGYAAGRMTEQV